MRIILADDSDIIRQTLRRVLEVERDFEIIGEASGGGEVIRLAKQVRPDVVIMDVNMPDITGIEATRMLHHNHSEIKVIGFSMRAETAVVLAMLNAGASGFVWKQSPIRELKQAIRVVHRGQNYISSNISGGESDDIRVEKEELPNAGRLPSCG